MPVDFEFLHKHFAGIQVGDLLTFLAVAIAVFVALMTLRGLLLHVMMRRAKAGGTRELIANLLRSAGWLFLLVIALYCGTFAVDLSRRAEAVVATVIQVVVLLQLGAWGVNAVVYGLEHAVRSQPDDGDTRLTTAMSAIGFIAKTVVWSLIVLLILGALKVNITALITGLGIGGIAVALAAQNILGDLFASLSILLDRPFAVGHFIEVGEISGTVERVGIKSTRIRSLSGEEIVLSNTNLLGARIHNYRHLTERRIVFSLGVTYDTPYEKLAAIPGIVRQIVESIDKVRFDRAHFKAYGDSSLDFEVVYFVADADFNLAMDIRQKINLAIFKRFAELGISFAFPTRTVLVTQAPSQ
jgi:small-conductance mechanosensitive channel